jgi:hypothetical protein
MLSVQIYFLMFLFIPVLLFIYYGYLEGQNCLSCTCSRKHLFNSPSFQVLVSLSWSNMGL